MLLYFVAHGARGAGFIILHLMIPLFSVPVGAELLSILDETENGFIWEHIQSYAEQAYGAWLGISVKG